MKVRPLKSYRTPGYPTIDAASRIRGLLSRIPMRWQHSPRLAALLGAGLMVKTLVAGAETPPSAGTQAPVTQAPDRSGRVPQSQETARQVWKATAMVAPVLAEALQYDGRGAVGCVAVDPPTFLTEAEALELIQNELKAAGLELERGVELDHVTAPQIGGARVAVSGTSTPANATLGAGLDSVAMPAISRGDAVPRARPAGKIVSRNWGGEPPELVSRTFIFDFADKKRSVFIEYLSPRDYTTWMGRSMSTVQSYDFPVLVRKVSDAFAKREPGKRMIFGVFFDPLARAQIPFPDTTGLDPAQRRMVREEYDRAQKYAREHIDVRSREKLRRQVGHFVSMLRQEGVIEAAQPGSSGTGNQPEK